MIIGDRGSKSRGVVSYTGRLRDESAPDRTAVASTSGSTRALLPDATGRFRNINLTALVRVLAP